MKFFLLFLTNYLVCSEWTKHSWRSKQIYQIPIYPDLSKLNKIETQLSNKPPIIFAGEADTLKEQLAKVSNRNRFLLIGGDCAELFKEFNVDKIRDTYRIMLQMSLILTYGSGLPIIKIGRMAGQFAKPRSDEFEIRNNTQVLTYRGDIINDIDDRVPDPNRMIQAYDQSTQTLNILRAFSSGGYADINRIHAWNLDFAHKTIEGSKYRKLANKVTKSLEFINGLGINTNDNVFKQTSFYTAHECLLLNYEESLTRQDSITNNYYGCSAHLLWLGERTRHNNSAHIEFMKGINNPIGIKISDKISSNELINLLNILNPNNIPGKIVLITRMGATKLKTKLPPLIKSVQNNGLSVVWCCDPMHANTIKTSQNIKTRCFEDIKNEIITFFDIHKKCGSFPGGLHLELTGQDITECIGGEIHKIDELDLSKNYLTQCDPRLNSIQSLEIAFLVAELLIKVI